MKITDVMLQANSNLMRNKLRTFLTVVAIFVGSFTIILTNAINTGVNSFIDKQVSAAGGEGYIEIMPSAFREQIAALTGSSIVEWDPDRNASSLSFISEETIQKVKELEHIKPETVRPFRSVNIEYVTSSKTDKKYVFNVHELPSSTINIDLVAGESVDLTTDEYQIAIAPNYPTTLGFDSDEAIIGQKVILAIKNNVTQKLTDIEAVVVGVQAPSVVSMGRSWINGALSDRIHAIATEGLPDSIANRTMFMTAEFDPTISDAQLDELKAGLNELGLMGNTVQDSIGMIKTFFDAITAILLVFGAIALLAASIGIINTLLMSVQERTREIGLMKAMGLSSFKVFLSFSFEAIMIGFWGSVLGIIVSIIVGNIGNNIAHELFLSQLPTFQLVEFTIPNMALITLMIMFIAFIAGTMPATRAARKNPIDALRYE